MMQAAKYSTVGLWYYVSACRANFFANGPTAPDVTVNLLPYMESQTLQVFQSDAIIIVGLLALAGQTLDLWPAMASQRGYKRRELGRRYQEESTSYSKPT